ncbi:phosphonoacetaldehyde hydrolase [Desulfobulbus alkaliphilus]|uniref:phosphonoacetaldehyde hydrolase n=1 Tax=Desulfobulbus alkaliphilus TaxID=869814 RepID=UPI0019622D02|nr:phosphonoacetaldehyde hydrolase [Desulfobulbus alkaliphilus]MBM9536103.1 phosphonoacetaldehyde hydrolase [Desulfobulbus alkaliphilus]
MKHFKAVVFDWAGTTIDFGSFAPTGVFVEAFRRFGIEATIAEARGPMGAPKRDHIRAMLTAPRLSAEWARVHGAAPTEVDVERVYEVFVPMNIEVVADYATLVPGCAEAVERLRSWDLKIGSTTGYTRSIMERVLPLAAAQGYAPDALVCSDDLPEGRPGPLQMYKCFIDLQVWPAAAVVKVDDTQPGIAEGVNAGSLTIGVALSGNILGRTPQELASMSKKQVQALRATASEMLRTAGAQYVIDTVAELPDLLLRLDQSV